MASPRTPNPHTLRIWQWNCRGYKQKQGLLHQYIGSVDHPPDIIALQETNATAKLPGYITHTTQEGRDVCTLVRKDIIAVQHILTASEHDHTFTELITQKPGKERSTFVLNVYCRPKNKSWSRISLPPGDYESGHKPPPYNRRP